MIEFYLFILVTLYNGHPPMLKIAMMPSFELCQQMSENVVENPPAELKTVGGTLQVSCVIHYKAHRA